MCRISEMIWGASIAVLLAASSNVNAHVGKSKAPQHSKPSNLAQLNQLLTPANLRQLDGFLNQASLALRQREKYIKPAWVQGGAFGLSGDRTGNWIRHNQSFTNGIINSHWRLSKIVQLTRIQADIIWQQHSRPSRENRREATLMLHQVRKKLMPRVMRHHAILDTIHYCGTERSPQLSYVYKKLSPRNRPQAPRR